MAAATSLRASPASNRDGDGGVKGREKADEAAASVEDHLLPALEKLSISSPSSCQKKLLILDLNGLLAHTFFPNEGVSIRNSRSPDAVIGRKYVFKRPFCHEFLRFCFEKFDVAIWSSAMRRNVEGAIRCVLGAFADRLLFIWDQADCTDTGFKTLENIKKPLFVKELRKVWDEDANHGLPQRHRGRFSPSNTLLIDDSPYKALLNPPNTAIFPQPYKVDTNIDDAGLGPDGELRSFLKGLAAAHVDAPSYVGSHPLGQLPIMASHRHWDFYSQVIDRSRNHAAGMPRSRRSTVRLREKASA